MRRLGAQAWLVGVFAVTGCADSAAPPAGGPIGLTLAPVDSGFDFSVFVAAPPNDTSRLLIVERGGVVWIRKNGARLGSAFIDLSDHTNISTGEYGVYSLAFHPQYAANRRLFVYYADLNGDSHLSEFQATPDFDHADKLTERTILVQAQDPTNVLYGGRIGFGPDGYLYIGLGDSLTGGQTALLPSSPAQDSTSLLGKMLRIDVDQGTLYTVPAGNPFVGRPGWRPEIWAVGLRNPWRWSFDRQTGEMWIGDVGEDTREEIDLQPAGMGGLNFGWPVVEGTLCYRPAVGCVSAGLTPPVLEYKEDPACAVMGGYVYRGRAIPEISGTYFFGDYCGGWVRSFRMVGGMPVSELTPLAAPLINDNVDSFGEDAAGEIYVVMASGRVYRIEKGS